MRASLRTLSLSLLLLTASLAQAATLVTQSFAGTGGAPAGWIFGGTAARNNDWLRLTGTSANQFGYGFYGTVFNANQGFVIDFEFVSWGGSGADGLTFFLFDGALANGSFRIGDSGGSLGYANGCTNTAGMRRAYLGIAFDEFGNFANPADRCKSDGPGAVPDAVTIRGAGDYTTGAVGTNYDYLTHGTAPTSIDCPACATRPATTSADWRRARITMLKSGTTWSVYVDVQFGAGQPFTRVVNPYTLPNPPYTTLKLGFAASTGGSTNYHEVRNLLVTNPVDTQITKTVSAANTMIGSAFSYSLGVTNTAITAAANVVVTDTLPIGPIAYTSYTIAPAGGSCTFATPILTCALGSMAISTTKTITVNATGQTQNAATNTATVTQDDIDINPNNNNASVSHNIWSPPSLTVVKSANGSATTSSINAGSNILYTITTTNAGAGPSTTNVLSDAMSPFTALDLTYNSGQIFQLIQGVTTSGLTLGTPVYSNDNGTTWTYTPVSGAGGAPAGFDALVTNFRIPMTGSMNGAGASYTIRYNTRVE